MPSSYEIHADHGLLLIRYGGIVGVSDIGEVHERVRDDPRYRPGLKSFSDMSDITEVNFGFAGMLMLSRQFREIYAAAPNRVRVAHYAPSDLAYGMARMYEALTSDAQMLDLGLFRTLPEALGHLGLNAHPSFQLKAAS